MYVDRARKLENNKIFSRVLIILSFFFYILAWGHIRICFILDFCYPKLVIWWVPKTEQQMDILQWRRVNKNHVFLSINNQESVLLLHISRKSVTFISTVMHGWAELGYKLVRSYCATESEMTSIFEHATNKIGATDWSIITIIQWIYSNKMTW